MIAALASLRSRVQIPPRPFKINPSTQSDYGEKIPKILNVILKLRNKGYSESTLHGKSKALKRIARHSNLESSESPELHFES
jgi:hypothetical protein